MKTIVTEEFDAQGKLTKRTTVTEDYATGGYVGPFTGGGFPSASCTCGKPWNSITPPPACPVHGAFWPTAPTSPTITVNTGSNTSDMWRGVLDRINAEAEAATSVTVDTDATPEQIATEVGRTLRGMA